MNKLERAFSDYFDGWERYGLKEDDGHIYAYSPNEIHILNLTRNDDLYMGPAEDVRGYYVLHSNLKENDLAAHRQGADWKPGRLVIEDAKGGYHVWVSYDHEINPGSNSGDNGNWFRMSKGDRVVHCDAEHNEVVSKPLHKQKQFSDIVAENVVAQLEAGAAPWQKHWDNGNYLPVNPATGKRYKGINAIHLLSQGRKDPRWMTYNQAQASGAQVRRGEKGTPIQFWRFSEKSPKLDINGKPEVDPNGRPIVEKVALERPQSFLCSVFNAEQIEGLPPLKTETNELAAVERAENILTLSGARIQHAEGNKRSYYVYPQDTIYLPAKEQFAEPESYYSAALQALAHWTGHDTRLNRDVSNPFGSESYAKQELVADIAAILLGAEVGTGYDPEQYGTYLDAWVKIIKDDSLEIFRAAAEAEKIREYVLAFEQNKEQKLETNASDSLKTEGKTKVQRKYLNVPYAEKDEAKKLGARWDGQKRSWYIPKGAEDITPFAKWDRSADRDVSNIESKKERVYLAVPWAERSVASKMGALWDPEASSWYAGLNADLGNLSRWLPENVTNQQAPAMTPREEFSEALKALGCIVAGEHPIMDGKSHRINCEGDRKGEKAGFYVAHLDGRPAGYIKNNRTGAETKWKAKGYTLNPQQKAALQAEAADKLALRATEKIKLQEAAALRVNHQLKDLVPVSEPTPYLLAKGITVQELGYNTEKAKGVLTDKLGKETYIPLFDSDGRIQSMQYIQEDGTKRFAKNSRTEGCFHPIGGMIALEKAPALVIAEGYATAASVAKSIGQSVVCCFNSSNIAHVAKELHAKYPEKPVIIAGDDDRHWELKQGVNPGRVKAEQAAEAVGGKAIFPVFAPGENDYPSALEPVTPQRYRKHMQAIKGLNEPASTRKMIEIDRALLSKDQLSALERMKLYTDFNDLATKSKMGGERLISQVRSEVKRALKDTHDERSRILSLNQAHTKRRHVHSL